MNDDSRWRPKPGEIKGETLQEIFDAVWQWYSDKPLEWHQAWARDQAHDQLIYLLSPEETDEMIRRKDDLDHQLGICVKMMAQGEGLPFPFERAVILLSKAGRHQAEADLCAYVANWAARAEAVRPFPRAVMPGDSPVVKRIIAREAKARKKATSSGGGTT